MESVRKVSALMQLDAVPGLVNVSDGKVGGDDCGDDSVVGYPYSASSTSRVTLLETERQVVEKKSRVDFESLRPRPR